MEHSEKIPIVIGDKCVLCSLQIVTVKGGKQVLYIDGEGTIVKREPLHRYKERLKRRKSPGIVSMGDLVCAEGAGQPYSGDMLLMCKDAPVYNITRESVLNKSLLPGAMARKTLDYSGWMKTRYSSGSNASARRLMLRAFGTDNHIRTLDVTRALSLSDCYWLKKHGEKVLFNDVTPYLNAEWDGSGDFKGGSISTLFVNGAADKRWLDATTLMKVRSFKEFDAYELCRLLGLERHAAEADVTGDGLLVRNFTSTDLFFESFEQSGYVSETDDARSVATDMFGQRIVSLFALDYLCEHDDRHWGNFGFLRDANTGEYLSPAPYFDFDWAWSDGVIPLPENALQNHGGHVRSLCERALALADCFIYGDTVKKRAAELLRAV